MDLGKVCYVEHRRLQKPKYNYQQPQRVTAETYLPLLDAYCLRPVLFSLAHMERTFLFGLYRIYRLAKEEKYCTISTSTSANAHDGQEHGVLAEEAKIYGIPCATRDEVC